MTLKIWKIITTNVSQVLESDPASTSILSLFPLNSMGFGNSSQGAETPYCAETKEKLEGDVFAHQGYKLTLQR